MSDFQAMSSGSGMAGLETAWKRLRLDEEEEGGMEMTTEDVATTYAGNRDRSFCLLGRFLTEKNINFLAMKNTLASVWEPGKGIIITYVGVGRYLFQFFHAIDMNYVLDNEPWTFNQHILLLRRLGETDDVERVPLNQISIWVQLHNLPVGFHSVKILQNIGNYIGTFLVADDTNFTDTRKPFLRIRVEMDVELPLKRRMKIKSPGSDWFWIEFRYEKLPTFCFICGCLGHLDRKCVKVYDFPDGFAPKPYGDWMRANPRTSQSNNGEKWFRLVPAATRGGVSVTGSMDGMAVVSDMEQIGGQFLQITEGGYPKEVFPHTLGRREDNFGVPTNKEILISAEAIQTNRRPGNEDSDQGITITDLKRRRVEGEITVKPRATPIGYAGDNRQVLQLQNEPQVGTGFQAHQTS